ncbi:MAG TPA: DUF1223 domain-containing protein [Reyranella sp.]|nr:DUF1223 domain-containing protein [Reyranella sp.]
MLSRRAALVGTAALAATPALAQSDGPSNGPWAIELFTSQGCSSCPPADARLGQLAGRPDIVALSFHVDYWDYIGWKDRFATKETTARQHAYARSLKQRYVYTPEMVVDGIAHDAGVAPGSIEALLAEARQRSPRRATPEMARADDGSLTILIAAFPLDAPADIVLAVYDRHHATPVHRGENDGRTLDNFNVVRRFETVARWNGEAAHWHVPADRFMPGQGVAVLVQRADQGGMLGCNKLEPRTTG